MATILLQAAGAFLGGLIGPVGATLGTAAGAIAGYMVDRALISSTQHFQGPRLPGQRLFSAEEGGSIPRLYGTARISGNLIWATRFEERARTTRQGSKGGPRTTTYHYFANAAFALCEGEIAGVRRVWADGRELDLEGVTIRVHRGAEDQAPDPLIEARQGEGNTPAYRGLAYAVIERLPLDDYGNRLPQFQFEVMRPVGGLHKGVRSVALIPGSTEYGLATEVVRLRPRPGETVALNRHSPVAASDIAASLDELQALCPNLENVALVVAWFGNDLRAGQCLIRPKVTAASIGTVSRAWRVSGLTRGQAPVVSQIEGAAAYGGTPADFTVIQAIQEIKARGLTVTLHPFIMMDVPAGNELPDPYGGAEQAAHPWRGRITCHPGPQQETSADKTAAARTQVDAFLGSAGPGQFALGADTILFTGGAQDWGFRRFVLHHAHLAAAAGGVDAFLIGSELRGLTTLRDGSDAFPFVEGLCGLADDVRAVLGAGTKISYGADWSEYFGHQPGDGSGEVFFHLDPFWAHEEVAAVAIHNYMPLADWRDADHAGGNPDGFAEPYDIAGLAEQVAGGEGYDWFYANQADRIARNRSPITDGAYGKPWVFRHKDLAGWWENQHFDRPGGVEAAEPTQWVPRGKPVWFTELGCPAVDKGPNQPNVFPDPKSSENAVPHFSSKGRSDIAQRRFIGAHLAHWDAGASSFAEAQNPQSDVYAGRMVDFSRITLWAWDARPFPAFPARGDFWADGDNWQIGHWLNGRLSGLDLGELIDAVMADHGLPPANTAAVAGSLTGYLVDDPTTARATLEPLADLFGITAHEKAGRLDFAGEGAHGQKTEVAEMVVPASAPVLERDRAADHDLPGEAELGFRDPFLDYQSAVARAARLQAGRADMAGFALPAIMEAGAARALLADWLARRWVGRETVGFSVAATMRDIEPGGLVTFAGDPQGNEYLVTRVDDGIERQVRARRVRRAAPAPWRPEQLPAPKGEALVAAEPLAAFLDLPMGPQAGAPHDQFRVAIRARPWRSQAVLVSPEGTGFTQRATVTTAATMGRLAEVLAAGFEGRLDGGGSILVELFEGELSSVSLAQMLNGANAAAIRSAAGSWEVVQFRSAVEVAPDLWSLSGLLRGQLGTGDAMAAGAAAGADFVLLSEAVPPVGLQSSETGLALNWRVVPAGGDIDDPAHLQVNETGGLRALTPLAPVHLRMSRNGVGDLEISWIRRGRIDADGWAGADIPLGEAQEAYRLEFAVPEGEIVREVETGAPGFVYAQAEIEADFDGLPEEIDVSVRQLSQAVGPGLPATRRFALA